MSGVPLALKLLDYLVSSALFQMALRKSVLSSAPLSVAERSSASLGFPYSSAGQEGPSLLDLKYPGDSVRVK